jgi:hypothetical protein
MIFRRQPLKRLAAGELAAVAADRLPDLLPVSLVSTRVVIARSAQLGVRRITPSTGIANSPNASSQNRVPMGESEI